VRAGGIRDSAVTAGTQGGGQEGASQRAKWRAACGIHPAGIFWRHAQGGRGRHQTHSLIRAACTPEADGCRSGACWGVWSHLLAAVSVRVMHERELPVRLLHVVDRRIRLDRENLVQVELEFCGGGGGVSQTRPSVSGR
jgi:hypothetical protein